MKKKAQNLQSSSSSPQQNQGAISTDMFLDLVKSPSFFKRSRKRVREISPIVANTQEFTYFQIRWVSPKKI